MQAGQRIKFMEADKITIPTFKKYKSSIKEVSISDFYEFMDFYKMVYDGQNAEIVRGTFFNNKNNNYYCTIYINGEIRGVFLELIKHFTNIKNHVILDENLFTL